MDVVFRGLERGKLGEGYQLSAVAQAAVGAPSAQELASGAAAAGISDQGIQESMRLLLLVRAYQVSGHYASNLDPLGLWQREENVTLDPKLYGFTEDDMDREFFLGTWRMKGFLSEERGRQTLRQILERLKEAYCGTIGFE